MSRWIRWLAASLCLCALSGAFGGLAEQGGTSAAEDVTRKCAFRVSEGDKGRFLDNSVSTTWSYEAAGAYVGVRLPEGVGAGWLRVEWFFDPAGFELIEYDAGMNVLRRRDQGDTFPNIYTVLPLLPETAYIQLKMTAAGQRICTLRVYSAGELPGDVQLWRPPVEKADLMVVSAHQDDELIFMGGTIPYYATALGRPTVVVYMANCARYRRQEALNALWKMGVRDYPEFINLEDKKADSIKEGVRAWGGKEHILSLLAERIRRYRPEVIVTHDLNGEYGHIQHKITAMAMKYAVDAAADPAQFPESAEYYGAWQVKKLYHHLYGENQIVMDWETPLDSLNGYTPLKVAQIGMQEHASQLQYYAVKSHGTYDNAKFGLYFTAVGGDVAGNDFLENIDPDASAQFLAGHPDAATGPMPTPTPEPLPTAGAAEQGAPAPTAAPEQTAAPEPTDAPGQAPGPRSAAGRKGGAGLGIALAAAVAAAGAGGWMGYRARSRRRRRRGRARR